jgi:hypothetical protein
MFAPFKKKDKLTAKKIVVKSEVRKHISTEQVKNFLDRHENQDWGEVSDADSKMNTFAVQNKQFVVSQYTIPTGILIIKTDGERTQTTVSIQLRQEQHYG